jgi:hypothetical protein
MKALKVMKRLAAGMCVVAAVAAVSMPSKAQALGFNPGDLALIIYGGDTEYYRDLGSADSILNGTSPTTVSLSSSELTSVSTNAALGLKVALIGLSSDSNSLFTGSLPASPSVAQRDNTFFLNAADAFGGWGAILASVSGGTTANNPLLFSKASGQSWTSTLGTDGSINGFMGFNTTAPVGSLLSIFNISTNPTGGSDVYAKLATAMFLSNGTLTITSLQAVPLPAAVVLFGTGLVALVGIARRKVMGHAA